MLYNISMNKSLTETISQITVCIISEHADIIHSNKVNLALPLA